jgi:isopentenyl diphosphate isomerase/L-lactate dehydrogenase-like FMN-dependent dehydrogenase
MMDKQLAACTAIDEVIALAKRRTPLPLYDFFATGAGSESALRRNTSAFSDYEMKPHVSRNVKDVDTSVTFLGHKLTLPLAVAPLGTSGFVNKDAELAIAAAAGDAGIIYFTSCVTVASPEDIAKACKGPKVFQLYPFFDREYTLELIDRAKAAGYNALCLTVDRMDTPGRARVLRWGDPFGAKLPPLRTVLAMVRHPRRALDFLELKRNGFGHTIRSLAARGHTVATRNDLVWDDWREFIERWGGPFLIKGILREEDAAAAVKLGADAIVVCNHGGVYLDNAVATINAAEDIVAGLPSSTPVVQCGGIRSGLHLLTSLAVGSAIGMTARPFVFGAAAAGKDGVARVIEIFRREFECSMRMAGCRSIADIDRSLIRPRRKRPSVTDGQC